MKQSFYIAALLALNLSACGESNKKEEPPQPSLEEVAPAPSGTESGASQASEPAEGAPVSNETAPSVTPQDSTKETTPSTTKPADETTPSK